MQNNKITLSSQAHAASQLNVRPTTKATLPKIQINQSKLPEKEKKIYSNQQVNEIPAPILKAIFDKAVLPGLAFNKPLTYQAAFNELSFFIVLLWQNKITRKANTILLLNNLQCFLRSCIDGKDFSNENYDKIFCQNLFKYSITDGTTEVNINSINNAIVTITIAIQATKGNDYLELLNSLDYFQRLHSFYNACNDYFIGNLQTK